jgi:molybdopterin converting factor subunit 1
MKTIHLQYFALLREQAGTAAEAVLTEATDAAALFAERSREHHFSLPPERLRVAINGDFCTFETTLSDGDEVVFLPPVAGG